MRLYSSNRGGWTGLLKGFSLCVCVCVCVLFFKKGLIFRVKTHAYLLFSSSSSLLRLQEFRKMTLFMEEAGKTSSQGEKASILYSGCVV